MIMMLLYVFAITLFSAVVRTFVFSALLVPLRNRLELFLTALVVFAAYAVPHFLEINGLWTGNIDFLYAGTYVIISAWLMRYTEKQLFPALFYLVIAFTFAAFLEILGGAVLSPLTPETSYFEHIELMLLPVSLLYVVSAGVTLLLRRPLKKAFELITNMQDLSLHYAGCVSVILVAFSLFIKYHQYNVGYLYEDRHLHWILYSALSCLLVYGFYEGHKKSMALKHAELNNTNIEMAKEQFQTYLANMHDFNNLMQGIDVHHKNDSIFETLLQSKIKQAQYDGLSIFYDSEALNRWLSQPYTPQAWINLTLIFGIFLDNAIEHLLANPRLGRHIHIKFMISEYGFTISNPVSNFDPVKMEAAFAPGVTSKTGKLLSGFGLHNALKMAEEIDLQVKWHWHQQLNAFEIGVKL